MAKKRPRPQNHDELCDVIEKLTERIDAISSGWAKDVRDMNAALAEIRGQQTKMARRIDVLESKGKGRVIKG